MVCSFFIGISMKVSQQGLRALMKSEAFKPDAYQDGGGVWTIGYGTIKLDGKPVVKGQRITQERAADELAKFVSGLESGITSALGSAPTSQCEFDAFINLSYNIGLSGFLGSTALERHIEGNKKGCAEAMSWWVKDGGKTVQGLINRRNREVNMYLNGIYVL